MRIEDHGLNVDNRRSEGVFECVCGWVGVCLLWSHFSMFLLVIYVKETSFYNLYGNSFYGGPGTL